MLIGCRYDLLEKQNNNKKAFGKKRPGKLNTDLIASNSKYYQID